MALIPGLEGFNFTGLLGKIAYWLGYSLVMVLVLAVLAFIGYVMKYNIPITVIKVNGGVGEGNYSIGKMKKNRVCWAKNRTVWKPLHPLFNRKELQPFSPEYIYPGNKIFAFEYNDAWIPGKFVFNTKEGGLSTEIVPAPYHVRNWQSLQHKRNAMEFAKQDFWSENKTMVTAVIVVFVCMIMVLGTAYFAYKMVSMSQPSASALTNALQNFAGKMGGNTIS